MRMPPNITWFVFSEELRVPENQKEKYIKVALDKADRLEKLKINVTKPQYVQVSDITYTQVDSWYDHCRQEA